jgi:hypothetical protein
MMNNGKSKSTAKVGAAPSVPVLPPVEYELAFVRGYDRLEETVEADVTSPLLDPAMHPSGSLRVEVFTRPAGPKDGPGFVLNSFMLASLAAYLREQALVRQLIEPLLEKSLGKYRASGMFRGRGGVWQNMKTLRLVLQERPEPTGRRKAKAGAARDGAAWEFEVVCRPAWDEHFSSFRLRDGKLTDME